jgi:F-type H+-transporting ATPase subunit delta
MSKELVLSQKYATAFLNLYADKINENVLLNIQKTYFFLMSHLDTQSLLSLPNLEQKEKDTIISLFLNKFGLIEEFKFLINLLIKQNRIVLLKDIFKSIFFKYQQKTNCIVFEISTANHLEDKDLQIIYKFLEFKTKKKIIPNYNVDKSLIAGISMKSDTLLWEYSVRKQLHTMKQSIGIYTK